ncbi:MAG: hypothetical protein OXH84_02400 [Gammaproteobacteria bacterium]|nr:hypothetical protein [Gammaproteobacteria bacterium]
MEIWNEHESIPHQVQARVARSLHDSGRFREWFQAYQRHLHFQDGCEVVTAIPKDNVISIEKVNALADEED